MQRRRLADHVFAGLYLAVVWVAGGGPACVEKVTLVSREADTSAIEIRLLEDSLPNFHAEMKELRQA